MDIRWVSAAVVDSNHPIGAVLLDPRNTNP